MKYSFFLLIIVLYSCTEKKNNAGNTDDNPVASKKELITETNNNTATVDIKNYLLITAENEDRKKDAAEILSLKRRWPLVMQSPTKAGFDSILARNFTFTGDGHLFNREDYITDRTNPSEWKITYVQYENLVLQFFGNTALLTYRNNVTNINTNSKEVEIEHMSWADIYVKEKEAWKIGASHTVDISIENISRVDSSKK